MRKDDLVDLVTSYGNNLPVLLAKIQGEINAANIVNNHGLATNLTQLKTGVSDLGIQYARDEIVKINDSPAIDTAIRELRKLKKAIDDIIASHRKVAQVLGVFSAALPLLKTAAGALKKA